MFQSAEPNLYEELASGNPRTQVIKALLSHQHEKLPDTVPLHLRTVCVYEWVNTYV